MFGTRKIFAKIINGKLVIRVGGGYMGIDEFMKHYGQQELDKQRRMGFNAEEDDDDLGSPSGAKKVGNQTVVGSAAFKRSFVKSPKTGATTKSFAAGSSPKIATSVSDLESQLR